MYSPHQSHANGDEGFFQAHADNISALLECERETNKQMHQELLEKLRTENLRRIEEEKWIYQENNNSETSKRQGD
jgi:hypothetical protein